MTKLLWILLVGVLGWPVIAEAATGSGAVDTWYVRPTGACTFNGDGLAYGCAASDGASGAFSTFANIIWTGTTGVDNGDTLYICGAHATKLSPAQIGAAGNNIIINGDCPNDAGSITVGSSATMAIEFAYTVSTRWVTVTNLTLSGGTTSVIQCNSSEHTCNGLTVTNNTITCTHANTLASGISIRSPRNNVITGNTISGSSGTCGYGIKLDTALNMPGDAAYYALMVGSTISNNTVTGFNKQGIAIFGGDTSGVDILLGPDTVSGNTVYGNGDGIYIINHDRVTVSSNVSHDNDLTNSTGEGYCYASTWGDNNIWSDNIGYNCRTKGIEVYADTTRVLTGVTIIRNTLYNNATSNAADFFCNIDVNNGTQPTAVWTGVQVVGNLVYGSQCGINIAAGVVGLVTNNTVGVPTKATIRAGILLETDVAGVIVANNVCRVETVPCIWLTGASGAGMVYKHNFYGTLNATTLVQDNLTSYTSGTLTTFEPTALQGDPLWISSTDYRTQGASTLRRAGSPGYPCADVRGRPCWNVPDIGAYQATSGDQAVNRTAR